MSSIMSSVDYIDIYNKKRILYSNYERISVYAEIKSETEDTIVFENCSVLIEDGKYLKISKEFEKKLGVQFSYGIMGFNSFTKMMQQMLKTNKKLIFSDIYSDDEHYCKEVVI